MNTKEILILVFCVSMGAVGSTLIRVGAKGRPFLDAIFSVWTIAGLASYVLPSLLMVYLARTVPVGVLQPSTALGYVVTILLGWRFLSEQPTLYMVTGVAFILVGVVLLTRTSV